MTTTASMPEHAAGHDEVNYLNHTYGLKSWLLTLDHKRIGLLYLITTTVFFVIGGIFASLIRLELMTPEGDLLEADTYNKMFTMHGVAMIFFFLIPSVPAVLGNFVLPIMIGNTKFPRTAGTEGMRKKKIIATPCMVNILLYVSASSRSPSGVINSRRIRLAKIPPMTKNTVVVIRYSRPIRLWSRVSSQDLRPYVWLR